MEICSFFGKKSFLFTFLNLFYKSQIHIKTEKEKKSSSQMFQIKNREKNIKKMEDDLKVL